MKVVLQGAPNPHNPQGAPTTIWSKQAYKMQPHLLVLWVLSLKSLNLIPPFPDMAQRHLLVFKRMDLTGAGSRLWINTRQLLLISRGSGSLVTIRSHIRGITLVVLHTINPSNMLTALHHSLYRDENGSYLIREAFIQKTLNAGALELNMQ